MEKMERVTLSERLHITEDRKNFLLDEMIKLLPEEPTEMVVIDTHTSIEKLILLCTNKYEVAWCVYTFMEVIRSSGIEL